VTVGFYAIKDLPMVNFNGQEVKRKPETLLPQQYRWLMEGLSVEQKKVIHKVKPALY
jgi:transposase